MKYSYVVLGVFVAALFLMQAQQTVALEDRLENLRRKTELTMDDLDRLEAKIERLQEPNAFAALRESGCTKGALVYGEMMHGENFAGRDQSVLCTALRADARELPACKRFSDDCEAELCLVEPHQGCTAVRRAEDFHGYMPLKAPVPSADRQGSRTDTPTNN